MRWRLLASPRIAKAPRYFSPGSLLAAVAALRGTWGSVQWSRRLCRGAEGVGQAPLLCIGRGLHAHSSHLPNISRSWKRWIQSKNKACCFSFDV